MQRRIVSARAMPLIPPEAANTDFFVGDYRDTRLHPQIARKGQRQS